MSETRIRVHEGTFKGEIMVDGMRASFYATIEDQRLGATFERHERSEREIDHWALFRHLQRWIEVNLAG